MFQNHKTTCKNEAEDEDDDDDVIFCGEYRPVPKIVEQSAFLSSFQLTPSAITTTETKKKIPTISNEAAIIDDKSSANKPTKRKRLGRLRGIVTFLKNQIPITSEVGQHFLASKNAIVDDVYMRERNERSAQFCSAPPLRHRRPNFLDKKPKDKFDHITFERTSRNATNFHWYKFPRRQFSTKTYDTAFAQYKRILLQQNINIPPKKLAKPCLGYITAERKYGNLMRQQIRCRISAFIDLSSDDEEKTTENLTIEKSNVLNIDKSSNITAASTSNCQKTRKTETNTRENPIVASDGSIVSVINTILVRCPQISISRIDSSSNVPNEPRFAKHTVDTVILLKNSEEDKENQSPISEEDPFNEDLPLEDPFDLDDFDFNSSGSSSVPTIDLTHCEDS